MNDPSELTPEAESAREAEIDRMLHEHAGWIRRRVRQRLGPHLRTRLQSGDIEQEALLRFVKYGPKLPELNDDQFKHLMARIVENVIRDQNDWLRAVARNPKREVSGSQVELALAAQNDDGSTPSVHAMRHEHEKLVHFTLGLLDPGDREIILLRRMDGMSFEEIGERLGVKTPAADARFRRAMRRFATMVRRVGQGEWDFLEVKEDEGDPD